MIQDYSKLVKVARALRGWTQTQLAEAAGVSRTAVMYVETGRNTRLHTLQKICSVLGVQLTAAENAIESC